MSNHRETVEKQLISVGEMNYCLKDHGYFSLPGWGKLRPHTVSRGWLIGGAILNVLITLVFFGAANLRVAAWQAEAVRSQMQVIALRQRMLDQQAANKVNSEQPAQCMSTVIRYQSTLNEAADTARQTAGTNPQSASARRLITLLKSLF